MVDFVSLVCPACGAQIRADQKEHRYICEYCGTEHLARTGKQREPELRERAPVEKPTGVQVHRDGQSARIVRRWFSLKYVPMAFFCVAWDAFLCFWYSMAFSQANVPWIMVVFPIAHLAVGVGLSYATLAGFVNRTVLEVEREEISLWHEPLPWTGQKDLKTADVKQFYTTEKYKPSKNGGHYAYDLHVILKDGTSTKLLSDQDDPQVALFFEQQLEQWLRIEDAPVRGELPRGGY
jgi:DNA-directed RNA polymerase subunit RPC12/RpoP